MSCHTTSYRFPTVILIALERAFYIIKNPQNRNNQNKSYKEIEEQAEPKDANAVVDFVCFFEELFHNREIIQQFQIIVKIIFEKSFKFLFHQEDF